MGIVASAIALLLGVHFLMTALLLQPDNPFRDAARPWVSRYMTPYFEQNWRMFAPDPEEPSKHIAVACRFVDPAIPESPVIDVTEPHYAALQAQRLTASQRIIRAQVYPLTLVNPPEDPTLSTLAKLADSTDRSDRDLAAQLARAGEVARERGMRIMARVASAECERYYPGVAISEVRILYVHERAPKFSQRMNPDARGEEVARDYGWRPFQRVALY